MVEFFEIWSDEKMWEGLGEKLLFRAADVTINGKSYYLLVTDKRMKFNRRTMFGLGRGDENDYKLEHAKSVSKRKSWWIFNEVVVDFGHSSIVVQCRTIEEHERLTRILTTSVEKLNKREALD